MSSKETDGRGAKRYGTRNNINSNAASSTATNGTSSQSQSARAARSTRSKAPIILDDSSSSSSADERDSSSNKSSKAAANHQMATANNVNSKKSSVKIDLDKLAKLELITSLGRSEAIVLLEAANNDLERAVELHFSSADSSATKSKSSASSSSSKSISSSTNTSQKRSIHYSEDSNSSEKGPSSAVYDNEDNVRAPIPQKSEKLLDYDPYALTVEPRTKRIRSVFDGNYDHYNEMSVDNEPGRNSSSKMKSLASLYRPPIEILFKGTFEASKIQGTKVNKWVLLNVQNQTDFTCQCLNRDLWRDETVKEIIKANFIFVQVFSDSIDGKKLSHYYKINEYPFVGVLDPCSGENMLKMNCHKLDQLTFCEKVTNFLCENESPIKDFKPEPDSDSMADHYATASAKTSHGHNGKAQVHDNDDGSGSDVVQIDDDNSRDSSVKSSTSTNNKLQNGHAKKELTTTANKAQKANTIIDSLFKNGKSTTNETNHISSPSKGKNKSKALKVDSSDSETESSSESSSSSSSGRRAKTSPDTSPSKIEPIPADYKPKIIKYEIAENGLTKDCIIRIMCPNGDRLDYCTNGECKFRQLVDYLRQLGYKKKSHELIERLMPTILSSKMNEPVETKPTTSSSTQSQISNDMSNLLLTNQSRNLLNSDDNLTYKQLNLYPRTFLLLQQI